MKTLYLSIILVFVFMLVLGLSIENAFATTQDSMKQYAVTLDKKEYSLYYNTTNASVDKITLLNGSSGIQNSILLNTTTGKYAELTLLIPNDFADSYLIGSQCDPTSGMLSVIVDGTEIIPMVNFTNNYLVLTINPLPINSKNVMMFETIVGGPGPSSLLFGIPDSIKVSSGQQIHLDGIVEDMCGRPELFNNTINLKFANLSMVNQTVTTTDGKFEVNFTIPNDVKPGVYDALFSWQFYERQPLHLFVENESSIPVQNFTTGKIVDINTLAKSVGRDLYNNDHYDTIDFYGFDWSPDDKFLYALVDLAPDYGIWKINTENGNVEKIKLPHEIEGYPYEVLRIFDNKILFATTKYAPVGGIIYVYKLDLQNNSLVKNEITSPNVLSVRDITQDGNIVYEEDVGARISSTYNATLWLADLDGKKIKMLYNGMPNFFSVSSSSDGQKLAFRSADSNLQTFDMQSGEFKTIPDTMSYSDWPAWSPDDRFVVYTNNGLGGGSMVLTSLEKNTTGILYTNPYQIWHPTVSPDGRFIAFGINYDGSGRSTDISGIYLVKLGTPIPEFPFAIPILLVSITTLLVFYRIKSQ